MSVSTILSTNQSCRQTVSDCKQRPCSAQSRKEATLNKIIVRLQLLPLTAATTCEIV